MPQFRRATAEALARMGVTVLACGRDIARFEETARSIRASTGNDSVATFVADFSHSPMFVISLRP